MSKNDKNTKIWNQSLDDIMSESFGKYAKYIIQDRALPDIRDGLKPVQRRILYAMNDLKIHSDKPYKKSARTVGEVIGKYHPHGDSSIYEAMVRMSQEWKNNIPLLDMQGNKGSIDGDGPAAMRYTECRLSHYGELLLDDIDKDTVKFIPNFDDSEQEPSILPSLLPNILVNGATGIAAGYATNVPPFNINEVLDGIIYRIKYPDSNLKTIASIIKGPDFPTGGIIQGREGIMDIFSTGKGKFNIRAKIESEVIGLKKIKRLIVTEIPYETNKAMLVKSLDEIRVNGELPGLKEVRDDSDKNGISIVLEIDTDKDLEIIKTFLYKKTQLQISYTANVVLIKDRKPVQCSLLDILDSYIEHANSIIIKSATYDLNKALLRKEILEGLIKTISEIDTLVALIKSSQSKDEAKQKISKHFNLSERQAEAVVQLRLYVLTSYDTQKLKDEYEELLKFIAFNERLINDANFRNQNLIEKLLNFKKKIGIPRKSIIEDEIEELEIEETDIIEEINGTCIVTRDNYIKFIQDSKIEEFNLEKTKIKDSDIPVDIFKLNTLDTLVVLTNKGKCITIPAHKIKFSKLKDNGVHVNEIITINSSEKTVAAFRFSKYSDVDTQILVATKNSLVKRFLLSELNISRNAKSISYINLKNDDEVVSAFVVGKDNKEIITISESGFAIRYAISEIPIVGRTASGVKNIALKPKDVVATSLLVDPHENFIFVTSNRGAKRIHFEDVSLTSRAKTGKRILTQVDSNPYKIHSGFIIGGRNSVYVLTESNQLFEAKVSDIPITDNTSRMNSFSKIKDNIVKCSNLTLTKNVVLDNPKNNFLTLQESEQDSKSSKEESPKKETIQLETIDVEKEIADLINNKIDLDNLNDVNNKEEIKKDSNKQQSDDDKYNFENNVNLLDLNDDELNSFDSNTNQEDSNEPIDSDSESNDDSFEDKENDSLEEIEETTEELEESQEEQSNDEIEESDEGFEIQEDEEFESDNSINLDDNDSAEELEEDSEEEYEESDDDELEEDDSNEDESDEEYEESENEEEYDESDDEELDEETYDESDDQELEEESEEEYEDSDEDESDDEEYKESDEEELDEETYEETDDQELEEESEDEEYDDSDEDESDEEVYEESDDEEYEESDEEELDEEYEESDEEELDEEYEESEEEYEDELEEESEDDLEYDESDEEESEDDEYDDSNEDEFDEESDNEEYQDESNDEDSDEEYEDSDDGESDEEYEDDSNEEELDEEYEESDDEYDESNDEELDDEYEDSDEEYEDDSDEEESEEEIEEDSDDDYGDEDYHDYDEEENENEEDEEIDLESSINDIENVD